MVLPWRSTVSIRAIIPSRTQRGLLQSKYRMVFTGSHCLQTDPSIPVAMNLSVVGTGISTLFNEAFALTNSLVTYDIQPPSVDSPLVSYWAKGQPGSFKIDASYAASVTTGALPQGLEFNATTLLVSGSPEVSGSYPVTITATNPSGTDPQNHQFSIYDPGSFAAKMEMALTGATAGEDPGNLPGLLVRLDASSLTEANGSVLSIWPDASGSGHPLDQARGFPKVGLSAELGGKKVVRFDGFSQLYSTYDFGSTLNSYSVLALARHCGDANGTVVGSVGSGWVFGWGNDSSSYWKNGFRSHAVGSRGLILAPIGGNL